MGGRAETGAGRGQRGRQRGRRFDGGRCVGSGEKTAASSGVVVLTYDEPRVRVHRLSDAGG